MCLETSASRRGYTWANIITCKHRATPNHTRLQRFLDVLFDALPSPRVEVDVAVGGWLRFVVFKIKLGLTPNVLVWNQDKMMSRCFFDSISLPQKLLLPKWFQHAVRLFQPRVTCHHPFAKLRLVFFFRLPDARTRKIFRHRASSSGNFSPMTLRIPRLPNTPTKCVRTRNPLSALRPKPSPRNS